MNSVITISSNFVFPVSYLLRDMFHVLRLIIVLLPVILSGCGFYEASGPRADYYYLNPNRNLSDIGRIAFVELDNDSAFPKISADVTDAFYRAVQKKQIFGLVLINQSNPAWRNLQLDTQKTYTLEQLSAIRKTLKCDAILKGTVTGFRPYPHMTIGLRLELIDMTDGQLLWALEQIWDTTDKVTADRIKNYGSHHNSKGFTALQGELGTVSSLKFVKFVAYEAAETLQPKK